VGVYRVCSVYAHCASTAVATRLTAWMLLRLGTSPRDRAHVPGWLRHRSLSRCIAEEMPQHGKCVMSWWRCCLGPPSPPSPQASYHCHGMAWTPSVPREGPYEVPVVLPCPALRVPGDLPVPSVWGNRPAVAPPTWLALAVCAVTGTGWATTFAMLSWPSCRVSELVVASSW
jgi:hypothetical protein